nr:14625_t:CDS:2 [Entrophospora candida]CAG8504781.1 15315_t:CDS:2 [Entrophospora candida]
MNSFKKLRKILGHLKPSNNELYIYMPLSDNKNGYIMDKNQRNYSNNSNNNSSASVNKSLWSNKDKECIFYQTVADKTQIDLENRWMELLRKKERIDIKVVDGNDNNGFSGEYQEWNQLMQHNNDFLLSDCIQRRRLDEVFGNLDSNRDNNDNNYLKNIGVKHEKLKFDEIDNSGSVNFDNSKSPSLSANYQSFTKSSSSPTTNSPLTHPALPPSLPSTPSTPPTHSSISPPMSPPMSPKLHPSSTYLSEGASNLQNLSTSKNRTMENQGSKKSYRKSKFSRKEPDVLVYDPEDNLVFKDCKCDHCMCLHVTSPEIFICSADLPIG